MPFCYITTRYWPSYYHRGESYIGLQKLRDPVAYAWWFCFDKSLLSTNTTYAWSLVFCVDISVSSGTYTFRLHIFLYVPHMICTFFSLSMLGFSHAYYGWQQDPAAEFCPLDDDSFISGSYKMTIKEAKNVVADEDEKVYATVSFPPNPTRKTGRASAKEVMR